MRANADGQIAPQSASVLFDAGAVLAFWAMPVAAAVLVAATGAGLLYGNRFLPWQLDWASLALAVALLVVLINWVVIMAFFVWVQVVEGLMIAGRVRFEEPGTGGGGQGGEAGAGSSR